MFITVMAVAAITVITVMAVAAVIVITVMTIAAVTVILRAGSRGLSEKYGGQKQGAHDRRGGTHVLTRSL